MRITAATTLPLTSHPTPTNNFSELASYYCYHNCIAMFALDCLYRARWSTDERICASHCSWTPFPDREIVLGCISLTEALSFSFLLFIQRIGLHCNIYRQQIYVQLYMAFGWISRWYLVHALCADCRMIIANPQRAYNECVCVCVFEKERKRVSLSRK